jgi:Serine/threonine protein kinase
MTTSRKPRNLSNLEKMGSKSTEMREETFIVEVQSQLSNSKYPVMLAFCLNKQTHYAMKVFQHVADEIPVAYINETRFISLSHPNIISIVKAVDNQLAHGEGFSYNISYILMELARGDFADIAEMSVFQDEKLLRTYFHQLIEGVEHLHSQGISHLDIKPENLLLSQDYQLKITDFDQSYKVGDKNYNGRGTAQYRAPEVRMSCCTKPTKADIYSLGITLFTLRLSYLPYFEQQEVRGFDLFDLLLNNPEAFWEAHSEIDDSCLKLSQDFKDLFISMTRKEPEQRASIKDIKQSKWYNGSIYEKKLLSGIMKKVFHEAKKGNAC